MAEKAEHVININTTSISGYQKLKLQIDANHKYEYSATCQYDENIDDLLRYLEKHRLYSSASSIQSNNGNRVYLISEHEFHHVVAELLIKFDEKKIILNVSSKICVNAHAMIKKLLGMIQTKEVQNNETKFWFYSRASDGDVISRRIDIESSSFEEVRHNYNAQVAQNLDSIFTADFNGQSGRIILWHGEPGTGKTSAIKILAKEASEKIIPIYVMDPEAFFGDPNYMHEVCINQEYDYSKDAYYRQKKLIILEDASDYISKDAAGTGGQNLSRLLNMSDGLLGRATDAFFLITTNEPLVDIHPALIRDGRCMANVEFKKLLPDEARAWVKKHGEFDPGVFGESKSIAELYALVNSRKVISNITQSELPKMGYI